MTFGIAIPTCKKHLSHLVGLLDSIEANTVLPDEVSISCSEVDSLINIRNYSYKVILTITHEYKTAGQNRNIAASKLSTDVISFIDSDDISTPFRNEYLIKSFENKEVKGVVHNYLPIEYETKHIRDVIELSPIELKINCINLQKKDFHNGHITIRKEIFNLYKYKSMKRGQDSEYTQRLISENIPISYISNRLSYYRNDDLYKLNRQGSL